MESGWYGKVRKLKEDRNRSTTSIVTLLEGERWRKFRSSGSSTQYWGLYPRIRVCAPFAGLRATGKVDASSRRSLATARWAPYPVLVLELMCRV